MILTKSFQRLTGQTDVQSRKTNLVKDTGLPGSLFISWTEFSHLCCKTSTIWKSGKRTKFGWGRRNAWQLSYFLDNYCSKTSIGAHLGKFQIQPTNNDNKREKDWLDLTGLQKMRSKIKPKSENLRVLVSAWVSHTHKSKYKDAGRRQICQRNYTTQFSGKRTLHTDNA